MDGQKIDIANFVFNNFREKKEEKDIEKINKIIESLPSFGCFILNLDNERLEPSPKRY